VAHADNARLQRIQYRHAKAAAYWQKAAALLPEESKQERALYLHEAGYDLHRITKYTEALLLWKQSLAIFRELGYKAGEGTTLNNISQIYYAWGDSATALKYLEQSLSISREIGDKTGEGTTLNNIGLSYYALVDYDKALPLYMQSLVIHREVGNREMEGITLSNIGEVHHAKGDYATAARSATRQEKTAR
jgi:tetratricopeptide (TPR) repeat protein